jgi:hypothetical protein
MRLKNFNKIFNRMSRVPDGHYRNSIILCH